MPYQRSETRERKTHNIGDLRGRSPFCRVILGVDQVVDRIAVRPLERDVLHDANLVFTIITDGLDCVHRGGRERALHDRSHLLQCKGATHALHHHLVCQVFVYMLVVLVGAIRGNNEIGENGIWDAEMKAARQAVDQERESVDKSEALQIMLKRKRVIRGDDAIADVGRIIDVRNTRRLRRNGRNVERQSDIAQEGRG